MPRQTALDTINGIISERNRRKSEGATQDTSSTVSLIDQLISAEEEKEREEEERRRQRNAASVDETMDLVRSYGDYGLERRAAETPQPVKEERRVTSNALTPEMEARYQQANGVNRAPTAYQTYMMQVANSQPKQEETRSTEELRRDMNRQNRLAKATTRMAADMGNRMTQDQSLIYNPAYTSNLRTMEQTMTAQQEKADRATNLYQTLSVQRREQEEREKYAALMSNPDFAAKSQADASIGNKTSATSLAPAERLYQKIFHRNDTKDINGNIKDAAGSDAARFVNDEEAAIFYYLWNTQGAKAAQSYYYGYVENRAGERRAQLAQQQAQAYGEYDPVGASIARVGYNAMSGIGLVDMAFQNLTRALGITDRNKPLNYNSDAQLPGQVADALQSGASSFIEQFAADEIKRINPNVKHPENYAKVASFLYQTGMSMADSSVAIALNLMGIPEPLTLANMGASAGTRAIRDARERGATDGQALAYGLSSALMEALFEKISLDRILEPSYATNWKQHFLNAWKQSFTEGSEEVMTTLANTAADMLIMGDKAELFAIQRRLMEQGVSEKEALAAAFKQWGTGIVGDLLGGMISGFGMGGVKEVGTGLGVFAQGVRQDVQMARALTDYQNAQQAAPQITPQQTAPVQQRQLTAREQNPLRFAMNKAQNGETVTGNDAKAILNDPQAVQTLRDAGVLADTIRPGAEGRAQIQQAVQALAEQNRAVTAELQQETERNSQLPVRNQQETAQERTVPPLPRQMAQEEQAPRQETLRLPKNEVTEPTQQAPLTIRGANATVEENRQEESYGQGQQTETAAAAGEDDFRARAETAAEGARRSYLDRIERSSGLGRVLQDLRNYRLVRGAESRASEVSRIRNQAEAGNQREVSAQDYGLANGTADKTAVEIDNATLGRVLGRGWTRAVDELARQGVTLKGITGQLWKSDGPPARAFFSGDGKTIVVQVDNPRLSWNQLLDHEDLHRRIKENPAYRKAVEDALLADKKLQAYLPEIIDRYSRAYAEHAPDLTSDDVIEELLADYRAGFDMLDPLGMNPITARAAKRAAKDIKGVEKELRKKVDSQRPVSVDDEARASREFDSDYMQAAVAYNQTSKHVPDSLMNDVAKVRETIKAKLEEIQDEARLPADVTGNTYFGNSSYNGSEENTTVCPRSLSVDALADAVGDALGRPLTIEETVYVAQQAFHFTDVPQCLYCYVAMDRMAKRQLLGEYVNKRTQVLTDIQNGMSREEALAAYKKRETSGGKQWSKNKQARFERWVNDYESGKPTLKMSDLSSEAQVEKTLANPDLRAEAQDALQYAQNASWAKKRVGFTAYNNHILKWDQKRINALNSMFGLRMYSFSDFSPAFILENMQMVTDAAVRGLKMLAYTKELDFVRIFAGTGMNINVSTFGMDGGDGKVHMDAMQGADWKEAQELRKKYPNVGVTFVATNDNQVNWALDQDWIDVVIPFHMVKTGATVADILGYQNYTAETSDKKIAGEKAKQKEIFPNQHQNNKEKYLAALEKARLTPRFERWLDHPNYMKLVNETRRSAGDTPAVQPKFDQEAVNAALKSLDDMVKRGGYGVPIGGSLENLADIAEEMSDDIRKGIAQDLREHNRQKGKAESQQEGKASTEIDTDYLAAVNSGDMETAQRMVDEAAKKAGYTVEGYHGTRAFGFTQIDTGMSDDNLSFFVTSDINTARTYSTRRDVRRIGDKNYAANTDFDTISGLQEEATDAGIDFGTVLSSMAGIQGWGDVDSINKRLSDVANMVTQGFDIDTVKEQIWTVLDQWTWDLFDTVRGDQDGSTDDYDEWMESDDTKQLRDSLDNIASAYVSYAEALADDNFDEKAGNYHVFVNPDGLLEIDCKGRKWNQIDGTGPLSETNGGRYWTTRTISQWAKANNYTGVKFHNLIDDGGYGGKRVSAPADVYSLFEPERQVKSADPITYDKNDKPIPLSERFNPADMDIRYSVEIDPDVAKQFSMEGIEERQVQTLLRENEELKKSLKQWKAQVKTSDRTQPREEDVRRMSRDLLKAYSSKADGNQVNESLRELAHTVMSNDARWTDIRDQAVRLAGKILEESSVLVGEDAALNREIRNAIREEKIAYTNKGDIADYGQWRKDNFGKLKIAKDGIPVDTRWEELQDTYGKGYFPDDIKNPADQIVYLSELFDRLQDVYENPYSQNMAEATEFLANDIIDRVISGEMRQAPTTYADRAETRLARETLRGELRVQKVKERLEAERERRKEQIAELKEHYKGKEAKGRENRKAKELRTKIINHAKQMTTELLKPTDKKHVPESLRKSVAAVLSAIDLGSGYDMTAGQNGNTLRVGRGTEGAEQTKRTKAFLELKEALMKEADGLVLDPELLGTVEEPGSLTRLITELADVPIANMNTEQLQVVYDALRGIEGAVKSANRMLSQARWAAVSEAADAIRSENSSKGPVLQLAGPAGRVQDLTRLDMLTPEGYFHRLGKSGQAVFKLLRSAQDKFITNMTQATEATRKIVGDEDVGALEKETHTLTMGGEQVTMTTAQIMELYCLMQRDQGLQHITTGGVLIEPVRKGIKQETQVEPLHPSMEELLNAVRLLTPDEVKMADALQKYLSEDLAELGNEATLNVYGYKKFGQEAKYWKIRSNKNEIQQSIEKETQTTSVANRGFTKAINPQANTSIKIGSIFDTYSQSVNDMATYAAWLDVGEDVNRIRNYVFRDSEGQRTGTVKGVLDRVIGTGGANYLQRLLADIANGAGMDDAGLTSGFVGAYKAAAIGANIRVIAQQPTAILRAAEMIDPKYLAVGLKNPMKAFERAKEYSPIAQWKDWGYFDINTGRKMKDVLFESSSKLEKVRQASMAMAGKADSFAWGQLWGAVEAETKDKTDLKPGTKEFYQACAERFNDIIDHTQVVDGILQRSQIMRSKNAITRMAVSFMSEPTKQYNQFMSAVYDYRHSGDKKQAKQMLARTTFSMVAAGILNVMAQALVDGLRDDDREKKYWEKVLQAFLGYNPDDNTFGEKFKTFAFSNMGEFINPASYLPYAKDIMSIIQGYSVDRMDMDAISDTITAMTRLYKAMNGEGKQSAGYSLVKAMEQAAKLLGLSVYNIDRDLTALFTTISNDADMPVLQYYLNRYRYKPTENLSKDLKGILWNARQKNDGSYDVIVNRLLKDGYTQEGIDKAMMNRLSDESGFTEARKAADAEGNNNGSYDLGETLAALDSIEVSEEDRDILLEAKLSEKQYSNYTTLLQYSDYDTWLSVMREMPANLSQAKIETVLDKRDDLTTKQKAAYWQVLSGATSTKNNPYSQEVGTEILNAKAENQPDKEPEKVAQMRSTLSGLGVPDSKADALAPVLGGDGTNTSKWRAVANQNLGTDQQDAVLKSIMTDSMYRNWTIASGENISLDSYVKGREAYVDLDDSGTDQNSEWTAALEKVTFDKDATRNNYIKGILWQIYTGSTSTKNNPFDKTGGQKVLDAKGKGGGKGTGSNAPARIPTLRIPEVPKATKPSSGLRIRPV